MGIHWSVQVWHAVSDDRQVIRKQYLETIIPPFAALLRRWRPLLSGIHEFTDADGQSPLAVEDRPLAIDALPLQVGLFISCSANWVQPYIPFGRLSNVSVASYNWHLI